MQKQTSIYIPKPCHEDWNTMTPTQQGKFCGSCSKQVIDFSLMNDNQILKLLSDQSGKLCGRFDADQLQRPLIETKIKKKKSWWMALTMPLLFLFGRSEGQTNVSNKGDTIIQVEERKDLIVGKLIYNPIAQTTITGQVVDENKNPLGYVTIMQKGTQNGTVTNNAGNFSIDISSDDDNVVLVASYVGYETIEKQIALSEVDSIMVNMEMSSYTTTGVIEIVPGKIEAYNAVIPINTVKTIIKKICGIAAFKIYPNPVGNRSQVHLEIKQAGKYKLQLLDNASRLVTIENINTITDKSITGFLIPSSIASGIYYMRLINEQTKKSYTEKLIIQ